MLFAGELAVRKVSEMESTLSLPTSRFSFRLTARIQVIWNWLAFSAIVLTSPPHYLATTYRAQYADHRGFCTKPPSQAWTSPRKSNSRMDYISCVIQMLAFLRGD